ncbi:MAG: dihydroxyacetone kinase subunit L [Rhodobacteraceae bacterium]|nr:dihydroxyacetone kinase subunit L [Paracoccaceae bacterium]PHR56233.1 MAG: Dak phosphatase [Robiginitomaculum sp.]
MSIDTQILRVALRRAALATRLAEDQLNKADARLGDGDTGETMRRLFGALNNEMPEYSDDIGGFFAELAKICARSTGSSLGTLVTVSMMVMAKQTKGQTVIEWTDLSPLLLLVRDQMMARGKANLGDKTVIDMLDGVATALVNCDNAADAAARSRQACTTTLDLFRDRENRIGRARMFAKKTIGQDDPGMLALSCLIDALSGDTNIQASSHA